MEKEIIFTIRKFPDIDNFSPLIDYLANKKNLKIYLFSLSSQDLKNDFRIKYLLKKYSCIKFIDFYYFFSLNIFQKFLMNCEYALTNKSIFLKLMYKIFIKLNLFYKLRKYFFLENEVNFNKITAKYFVIDHLTPKKIFYFNLVFKNIKKKKIKILSFPAGLPLYVKHPKAWDRAKLEISNLSYKVDKIVFQHKHWMNEVNEYKKINGNYKILGSLRFTKKWRNKLLRILTNKKIHKIKNKINIVYMDSNNSNHIDFKKLKQKTLNMLSENNLYDVRFKPHPRSNKIFVNINPNLKICKNEESVNLIDWADIVLGDISAIMLEAVLQNKRYISLSYLRKKENVMLYDKYKICEECKNIEDLNKIISQKINSNQKKVYKKNLNSFMNDFVYFPNNNVIKEYSNLIFHD